MKLSQVYEGWKNALLPEESLKEIIATTKQHRMEICNNCEYHSKFHKTIRTDDHCTKCSCPLFSKTACLSCHCPLHKWEAVTTDDQEKEMKNE